MLCVMVDSLNKAGFTCYSLPYVFLAVVDRPVALRRLELGKYLYSPKA